MKKLLAFLVLISHMNFFMFIPQVDEVDQHDASGREIDDVNSLIGLIDQAVFGDTHSSPEDEDDDNARFFHIVKIGDYSFQQQAVELKEQTFRLGEKTKYPSHIEQKPTSGFFDIQAPPPKV